MRWLVIDRLYNAEAFAFGHLDSYGFYIESMGEQVDRLDVSGQMQFVRTCDEYDVIFALEGYDLALTIPAKVRIAQVACGIEVPRGFSMIVSSIPAMVERYAARRDTSVYQPLAFDLRARACMMGVKREKKAIFIGTRSQNHRRREEWLTELADIIEIVPPVFGHEMFKALASARVVLNVHAEWSQGAANSMRLFESAGMGCAIVSDGRRPDVPEWPRPFHLQAESVSDVRMWIDRFLLSDEVGDREIEASTEEVLRAHTYESRVPRLIEMARSL